MEESIYKEIRNFTASNGVKMVIVMVGNNCCTMTEKSYNRLIRNERKSMMNTYNGNENDNRTKKYRKSA